MLQSRPNGSFLVRESATFPGDYTLCVAHDGIVEHYRVLNENQKLTVDEEAYFDTLIQLIQVLQ